MTSVQTKSFEIFSGTGGVGKTTLAASRAIFLAEQGKSVLLITIDPAKRLKEVLGMREEDAGKTVPLTDPFQNGAKLELDAQLMQPERTLERIAGQSSSGEIAKNRIMKILARPYGGLNEILSVVELRMNMDKQKYDVIVLDTPPGSHFLDFLESGERIRTFFDQSFVDIFNFLGKRSDEKAGSNFMVKVVSSGVKKLLGYLSKVTGASFVDEFLEAVYIIYQSKDVFMDALNLQNELRDPKNSNWFLVTSVEQNKVKEAMELSQGAKKVLGEETIVALNKCLKDQIQDWSPQDELGERVKNSFTEREEKHARILEQNFPRILRFPESLQMEPIEHVRELKERWKTFLKE